MLLLVCLFLFLLLNDYGVRINIAGVGNDVGVAGVGVSADFTSIYSNIQLDGALAGSIEMTLLRSTNCLTT